MNHIDIEKIKYIRTVEEATAYLFTQIPQSEKIQKALSLAIKEHEGQFRRSGEPYIVHPILVASIAASITEDEAMVIAAIMHDLVEDTHCTTQMISEAFSPDVAHLVEGMTKIDSIRDTELIPSHSNEKLVASALSFRKMLLASIHDVRVLVVKLCDRLHNMLTLDALPPHKQHRISEETLVVYAPIAHRLGISFMKKLLEDLSFHYLFSEEEQSIDAYLNKNHHAIELKLNGFRHHLYQMMLENGFMEEDFEIISRVKHHYSIYLKMQRKGISIDEILDLLAVRILVKNPIDCYKVLGLIHLRFQPLSSRFKDYISLAKDNGYQTLHTTVFDNTTIFEVQIRTYEMHETAELGVAAHWKYKSGSEAINLDWLNNLQYQNESVEDFYELIKNDLYSEDISVFSPKGEAYTLPRGAVALDFAYAIHSEIGETAESCLINKEKMSLLSEVHNADIVKIITGKKKNPRCSWIDAVKTSRAKSNIKANCNQRRHKIDTLTGANILATIMGMKVRQIDKWFTKVNCEDPSRLATDRERLKEAVYRYIEDMKYENRFKSFVASRRFKLKAQHVGSLEFISNHAINDVVFDYCCHPKTGDEIVAFLQKNKAHIHHKMCKKASKMIEQHESMLFVKWINETTHHYHLIASMHNAKGALASFLTHLAKLGCDIRSIELGKEKQEHIQLCEIEFQNLEGDISRLRAKIEQKIRVIQFIRTDDAYR